MAPMSSHMKPNIATRASSRVPLTLQAVANTIIASAMAVVFVGVTGKPRSCATNGAPPVATAAIETRSAQP